jgi:uncharacterized protein YcsI (UPF0317 family)
MFERCRYDTNIPCRSGGQFSGNMVVSMRPLTPANALYATQITARYPRVHGAPVHFGDPVNNEVRIVTRHFNLNSIQTVIGISDISSPNYGDAVEIKPGEIPVFWACGVTPQAVVMKSL